MIPLEENKHNSSKHNTCLDLTLHIELPSCEEAQIYFMLVVRIELTLKSN